MELRKERGSSILEFAIGASLLVLLFTGIFQFGYTFYAYSKLENAVRAGARFAALSVYPVSGPTTNSSPTSAFVTQVKNVTVFGHPNGAVDGRTPMVSGLTTAHVSVNVAFSNNVPTSVSVGISGLRVNGIFGTWQSNGKPKVLFQYVGRYAPPIT